ncbi:MAG: hypothetical protein JKX69_00375 [Rhodobacteraceae bacterium]|nr:hypothetical protein [Paracoccaceae bacterium]
MNRQQFARYLNGATMPRANMLHNIARYFGVEAEMLTGQRSELKLPHESPFQMEAQPTLGVVPQNLGTVQPPRAGATHEPGGASTNMFAALFGRAQLEPITHYDLEPGFYVQYKNSFSVPGKIIVTLAYVKERAGQYFYKRRNSAKILKHLPGMSAANVNEGVFAKQNGFLILIDIASIQGALTFHAFRPSTEFSRDIMPGLHLFPGFAGAAGPMAGRIVLQKMRRNQCPLGEARQQCLTDIENIPAEIRRYLIADADTGLKNQFLMKT